MDSQSNKTFSDDDLKKLKGAIKAMIGQPGRVGILPEVAELLVARLEAAEMCVELCSTDENCCAVPEFGPKGNVHDAISWLDIWREAAGK